MLPLSLDAIRLFLHVTAATVWVGGQIVLAGLVPVLRAMGPDAPRAAARRFGVIAWPAFGLLVATGVWNVIAERDNLHGRYATTLTVKLVLVVLSGLAALVHTRTRSRRVLAVSGALAATSAVAAVLFGVLLAG